jgi:hypothetical protein
MLLSNAPAKLTLPFANAGGKRTVPVPSQIPITPGAASYTDGFPPLTRTAVTSGGIPPSGLDMNGVLNEITDPGRWFCAGGGFLWDSTFATDTNIGGYPKGARVLRADGLGYWLSLVDNNLTDPDTGGAGWVPEGGNNSASVYASAQQTLAMGNAKILYDTVEFDPSGLWNAGAQRFIAPWAGKYRFSGATFLSAPDGQNLAAEIWKNGALAKRCIQFPQVSDVDLALPFDAILSLAASDYVEAYLNVTQAAVAAGQVGSNQAYVYAQLQYLGQ